MMSSSRTLKSSFAHGTPTQVRSTNLLCLLLAGSTCRQAIKHSFSLVQDKQHKQAHSSTLKDSARELVQSYLLSDEFHL